MQECTRKKSDHQRRVLPKAKLLRNDKRVRAIKIMPRIDLTKDKQEGDAMADRVVPNCKTRMYPKEVGPPKAGFAVGKTTDDLAFAHWQQHANEKAYAAKLITKAMYEFARDEIHKKIASFTPDKVVEACYNV